MFRRTSIAFLSLGIILMSGCTDVDEGSESPLGPDVAFKGKPGGPPTPDPVVLEASFGDGAGDAVSSDLQGAYAAEINVGNGDNFRLITGPGGFAGNEDRCVNVSIGYSATEPPIDDCLFLGFATQDGVFGALEPGDVASTRGNMWWPHGDVEFSLKHGTSCPAKGNADGGDPGPELIVSAGPDGPDSDTDPDTYTIETDGGGAALLCQKTGSNRWTPHQVTASFSITVVRP